jgi:DNA-binding response OmpR family regulator
MTLPDRPTGGPRVLVVEDNHDLAEALQLNLRDEGFRVSTASDGRQALAMVRACEPDLIVLDLGLPGIDGLTVLAGLRAEDRWCPVLILSARDADADMLAGFRLGADDYVTKPFRTVELIARLQVMARRLERERRVGAAAVAPTPPPPPTVEQVIAACGLTARQAEIALLLGDGSSNPDIARQLGVSRFTVRNHVEQVLARLGVPSRWHVTAALVDAVRALQARGGDAAESADAGADAAVEAR